MSKIFISYSHEDKPWLDRLQRHLGVSLEGFVRAWSDKDLCAGDEWRTKIADAIDAADIAIFLVSFNSLTSKFIVREEIPAIRDGCARRGVRLIPLIVTECDWQGVEWIGRARRRQAAPEHEPS